MLSDAPPSATRDDLAHVARLGRGEDLDELGDDRAGGVPQLMMTESFHQSDASPPMFGMSAFETTNVRTTETIEVRRRAA